jgi:SHS2 domain-containing protein
VQRDVEVNTIDGETLLVNWLDELLHLQETQRENCGRFDIPEISDKHLRAEVQGHLPEEQSRSPCSSQRT